MTVGLRLCKCVPIPTVLSPKTLERQPRQPHKQAPRYSRSTFLAIRKVRSSSQAPRGSHARNTLRWCCTGTLLSLGYAAADIRDQRHCEHPTLAASRATPVSRAACSYPGQFHVHVPEGLKPGTQSRFCCSCSTQATQHSARRRWKLKAGHISPQNSSPLARSGIISLAAQPSSLCCAHRG
jgi:hypothetical protein